MASARSRSFTEQITHYKTHVRAAGLKEGSTRKERQVKIQRWRTILEKERPRVSTDDGTGRQERLKQAMQRIVASPQRNREGEALPYPSDAERKRIFEETDKNGNGYLSLAELDLAVKTRWPGCDHSRAVMRAYRLADRKADGWLTRSDNEQQCEWSHFLRYLSLYTAYWARFAAADLSRDGHVDINEWRTHGNDCLGLTGDGCLSEEQLDSVFEDIDSGKDGYVRFDEFCAWAAKVFGDTEIAGDQKVWQPHMRPRHVKRFCEARAHPQWD